MNAISECSIRERKIRAELRASCIWIAELRATIRNVAPLYRLANARGQGEQCETVAEVRENSANWCGCSATRHVRTLHVGKPGGEVAMAGPRGTKMPEQGFVSGAGPVCFECSALSLTPGISPCPHPQLLPVGPRNRSRLLRPRLLTRTIPAPTPSTHAGESEYCPGSMEIVEFPLRSTSQ
jgi:hypothetical protein